MPKKSGSKEFYIVTTETVPNKRIKEVLGAAWGSEVRTKGWTSNFVASMRTMRGGEVPELSNLVRDARMDVVHRMVENAKKMGANGIVGMRMLTNSVKPGMVEFVVYGTAVVVE